MDMTQVTKAYTNIRAARNELRKEYEDKDKVLKENLTKLEALMLDHLDKNNVASVRTEAGTFYRQEEVTPQASDWNLVYEWIKDNDAWDLLERRLKKTFVKEYMEAHDGGIPPGVSTFREFVVRVRKG